MLVDDATIAWIGDETTANQHVGAAVVDLDNAVVTPAFVDAHVHTTATGIALSGLDLSAVGTLAQALDLIERAARSARGRPVLGGGWDETRWPERRPPSARELDRAGYGGAIYLARVDAHSAVVSSSLAASVRGLRDLAGYRPDGLLTLRAHDAARAAALAALTAGQTRDLQRTALRHAASLGIACVHEMAGPAISGADDLTSLLSLADEEPGPEVIGYWGELGGVDTARELGASGAAGDLFCDGSLGSHTAALREPYTDAPDNCGVLRFDTAQLAEHVLACIAHGLQAGFHAIGDAALDQVLDALELASERLGRPAGTGHRLEHVEFVHDPARLAASGILACVQPMFDATWGGAHGMYAERLGPARAAQLNRFADLAAAGVELAFGSDTPVTALGPWAAVRAAAYPTDPAAALSAQAAFTAHTRGAWRAARRGDEGVLAPGTSATFAVWDVGVEQARGVLPDLTPGRPLPTCLATVLRGRTLFDAGRIGAL